MDALALSPRGRSSPAKAAASRRGPGVRPRSPPPAACVDIQWTFIRPLPSARPSSRPHPHQRFSSVDSSSARDELQAEQNRLRRQQEEAHAREQRALYDLMGETQRQAMLDQVMAEMEAMALAPVKRIGAASAKKRNSHIQNAPTPPTRRESPLHAKARAHDAELLPQRRISSIGSEVVRHDQDGMERGLSDTPQSEDEEGEENDADLPELRAIRERHRRRASGEAPADDECGNSQRELRILWQQSAHVRMALDLPRSLVAPHSSHQDASTRQRSRSASRRRTIDETPDESSPSSPDYETERAASPRERRVRKAQYGSWYLPRDQWWTVHQTEQATLAEQFPDEQPTPVDRHICLVDHDPPFRPRKRHHAPIEATPFTWPSLLRTPACCQPPPSTVQPLTGLLSTPRRSARVVNTANQPPNATAADAAAADPIAQRATELQRELSKAYIAQEFRHYLLAKGARVPEYLSY